MAHLSVGDAKTHMQAVSFLLRTKPDWGNGTASSEPFNRSERNRSRPIRYRLENRSAELFELVFDPEASEDEVKEATADHNEQNDETEQTECTRHRVVSKNGIPLGISIGIALLHQSSHQIFRASGCQAMKVQKWSPGLVSSAQQQSSSRRSHRSSN
jgi:hypothetical protein